MPAERIRMFKNNKSTKRKCMHVFWINIWDMLIDVLSRGFQEHADYFI